MRRRSLFPLLILAGLAIAIALVQVFPAHPPAEAALTGDANCNSDVNPVDAALVLQLDAGLLSTLPCATKADVNLDGAVNAVDAALILQYSAGLLVSLQPDPFERTPSAYWVDCRNICFPVLHPDVTCQQSPPGMGVSEVACQAPSAGWEMTCWTAGASSPHVDCLHSQDGAFSCAASPTWVSGSCDGTVWYGICSGEPGGTDLHCWRTDPLGTETVDCVVTYVGNLITYQCEWEETMAFTCQLDTNAGTWECLPEG